jgi:hypothetical protein
MPCEHGGQSFPTDTVRVIDGQRCICANDGEWVPLPIIGDGNAADGAKPA